MKNIYLIIIPALLLMLFSCGAQNTESISNDGGKIDAGVFESKIKTEENHVLIDVRTPEEFASNHIKGAININVNSSNFSDKIKLLDKSNTVLVYCKSGGRSAKAFNSLQTFGYTVYELKGGLLKWQAAGLPVEVSSTKDRKSVV